MPNRELTGLRAHRPKEAPVRKEILPSTASDGRVAACAIRINHNWHSSRDGILKIAQDCAFARREFSRAEKAELYPILPFGEAMFSKLASIGDDPRLWEHRDLLPPSISTMDEARKLNDETFRAAISDGALKPDAKRQEFVDWVRAKSGKPDRAQPMGFNFPAELCCLYPDEPLPDDQHEKLRAAVVELADSVGVKAAFFTGENLVGQLKEFWAKKPAPT